MATAEELDTRGEPSLRDERAQLTAAIEQVNRIVLGKRHAVRLAFAGVLAGGHLLLEDLPGMGKTTLAHALAATLGLSFSRIQFTSDLLPSDIIGVSVFEREHSTFRFHPGPVFAQLVMADEINRATPKTQSALLEAMAEHQVTVDGELHPLREPFVVIATQNPLDLAGTYPLPDSQLDRFLLRISLGYPPPEAEREMLASRDRRELLDELSPQLDPVSLMALRRQVDAVVVRPALLDYLQALLLASRSRAQLRTGLSPRAGLALLHAARAWALLGNRDFVLPEDVQAVFVATAGHRLVPGTEGSDRDEMARQLIASVPVDRE